MNYINYIDCRLDVQYDFSVGIMYLKYYMLQADLKNEKKVNQNTLTYECFVVWAYMAKNSDPTLHFTLDIYINGSVISDLSH